MARRAAPRYHRLSESPLWAEGFYERAGIDAWRAGVVPHHVTNNVALATAYARVVVGFLRDTRGPEPLQIVELGAGSGRFAFLFLRALDALRPGAAVRYVMTDVAPSTIAFWRRHPALAPFVRAGRLVFARFDANRDRVISRVTPGPRLVVIASYVFSALAQDAFEVTRGRTFELHVAARRGGSLS